MAPRQALPAAGWDGRARAEAEDGQAGLLGPEGHAAALEAAAKEAVAALGLAGRSLSRGEPAHSSPSCPETCRRSSSPSTIQNRSIFLTLVLFPFEQYHILFIIFGQYNYIVYYINIYGKLYNAHIYEHYIPSLFTVSCLRTADIIFLPFLASLLPNYLRESAST